MADDLDRSDNGEPEDPIEDPQPGPTPEVTEDPQSDPTPEVAEDPWASEPLVPHDPDVTEQIIAATEALAGDKKEDDPESDIIAAIEALTEDAPTEADAEEAGADRVTVEIEEIGPGTTAPEPTADDGAGEPGAPDDQPIAAVESPAAADEPVADEAKVAKAAAAGATVMDRTRTWFRNLIDALRDPSWRHGKNESFRFSVIVFIALGIAWWFTSWPLPNMLSSHPDLNFYLIQPLIWLSVAALALHGWYRLENRPPLSKMLIGIAFLVGLFHVAILLIAGVIWGFGDSPIAGRLINYPKNFLYIATWLAGLEASRAYLYHVWKTYLRETLAVVLVSAIFFVVVIPVAQWTAWDGYRSISTMLGGQWAPALALSVLATFLVDYGGMGPSFAYRFALLGLTWFSPILPDLAWPVLLIIGVMVPVAAASLVQSIYEDTAEGGERAKERRRSGRPDNAWYVTRSRQDSKKRNWVGWAVTAVIAVLIVLFFNGTFGFRMVVIEGISMEPAYERGDLAIVRESIDFDLLEVDDVIVFEQSGRPVVHRIIAIDETPLGLKFTTKGDNVDRPDLPVLESQITGKVVFLIPAVGHVNLWLRGG